MRTSITPANTPLLLTLLLSLSAPILSAPIPISSAALSAAPSQSSTTLLEECSQYASCRPFRSIVSSFTIHRHRPNGASDSSNHHSSSTSSEPATPYFPPHQVTSERKDSTTQPILRLPPGQPIPPANPHSYPGPETVPHTAFKTAVADHGPVLKLSTISGDGPVALALSRHPVHRLKKVGSKCIKSTTTTFTYGYTVIKRDYTDVLVVGIVAMFLVAVILVELMDRISASRNQSHLPSSIRLGDSDEKNSQGLPQYEQFAESLPAYETMPQSHQCVCQHHGCGSVVVVAAPVETETASAGEKAQ